MKVSEAVGATQPTEPGFYWATIYKPDDWQPVEVTTSVRGKLFAFFIGLERPVDLDECLWGPRITMPEDLAVEEAGR